MFMYLDLHYLSNMHACSTCTYSYLHFWPISIVMHTQTVLKVTNLDFGPLWETPRCTLGRCTPIELGTFSEKLVKRDNFWDFLGHFTVTLEGILGHSALLGSCWSNGPSDAKGRSGENRSFWL